MERLYLVHCCNILCKYCVSLLTYIHKHICFLRLEKLIHKIIFYVFKFSTVLFPRSPERLFPFDIDLYSGSNIAIFSFFQPHASRSEFKEKVVALQKKKRMCWYPVLTPLQLSFSAAFFPSPWMPYHILSTLSLLTIKGCRSYYKLTQCHLASYTTGSQLFRISSSLWPEEWGWKMNSDLSEWLRIYCLSLSIENMTCLRWDPDILSLALC